MYRMSSGISCDGRHVIFGSSPTSNESIVMFNREPFASVTFYGNHSETKQNEIVTLDAEKIGKLMFVHKRPITILLIYPTPDSCYQIQRSLALDPEQFRPCSLTRLRTRICLMLENVSSEDNNNLRQLLKEMLKYKMEELNFEGAEQILEHYKDKLPSGLCQPRITIQKQEETSANESSTLILRYPQYGIGCISINVNDYMDLKPKTYLNDAIIDFYLKYFYLEMIPDDYREKIHVFDSFFYTKLSYNDKNESKTGLTEQEKKEKIYERVAKWDEKVNLFSKDFIFIPVNLHEHWFLAVICHPKLKGRVLHRDTGEEIDPKVDKTSPVKQSCILIFDSMGMDRPNVLKLLRIYLTHRYIAENDGNSMFDFNTKTIPGCYVKVPQQPNSFDCGLYLLHFVVSFYTRPITDFRTPIKGLENWFEQEEVINKRKEIKELIDNLAMEYKQNTITLPVIDFNCNEMVNESIDVDMLPDSTTPEY